MKATVNSYTWGMPAPDKTSLGAIVHAARQLVESDGLPGLTMQSVAQRVGVRAPSLYKRVGNRDELIRLVAEAALSDLSDALRAAPDLYRLAEAFRSFGHLHPAAFQLIMAPGAGVPVASLAATAAVTQPVIDATRALCGEARGLDAARTLTAWATGFIIMENNGGFRLDGDVEEAWRFGLERILEAIARSR